MMLLYEKISFLLTVKLVLLFLFQINSSKLTNLHSIKQASQNLPISIIKSIALISPIFSSALISNAAESRSQLEYMPALKGLNYGKVR